MNKRRGMVFSLSEKFAHLKGYRVDLKGNLLAPSGKIRKCRLNKGYPTFTLRSDKKVLSVAVHRLQAFQKYGDKIYEEGIVVRHLNGCPEDNTAENISIGTFSDNRMDIPPSIRTSTAKKATAKVRKFDKGLVKTFYEGCRSYKKTMLEFGISSKGTLSYILNN